MRYAHLWIIAAASAAVINLGSIDARAEQGGGASCKPSCDEAELRMSCGMDIACGAACEVMTGEACHAACAVQDDEQICLEWCGMEDCHDDDCWEWRCMAYCQQEYWHGCDYRCDTSGALFCDGRHIALIWDKPACYADLCEAKMLSGEACEP